MLICCNPALIEGDGCDGKKFFLFFSYFSLIGRQEKLTENVIGPNMPGSNCYFKPKNAAEFLEKKVKPGG